MSPFSSFKVAGLANYLGVGHSLSRARAVERSECLEGPSLMDLKSIGGPSGEGRIEFRKHWRGTASQFQWP